MKDTSPLTVVELISLLKTFPEDSLVRVWEYGECREYPLTEADILYDNGILLFQ